MAAADEAELVHMVATQVAIDDRPSALRYPRGEGVGVEMPEDGVPLEIGKGRIMREGHKVALLSFGTRLAECLKAADELAQLGLVDHGRRCALRQAARHRSGAAARARARGADHHRGRRDRRLRHLRDAGARRERRARSRRAQGAHDGAARHLHRSGFARTRCTPRPASTPKSIVAQGVRGARPREDRRDPAGLNLSRAITSFRSKAARTPRLAAAAPPSGIVSFAPATSIVNDGPALSSANTRRSGALVTSTLTDAVVSFATGGAGQVEARVPALSLSVTDAPGLSLVEPTAPTIDMRFAGLAGKRDARIRRFPARRIRARALPDCRRNSTRANPAPRLARRAPARRQGLRSDASGPTRWPKRWRIAKSTL